MSVIWCLISILLTLGILHYKFNKLVNAPFIPRQVPQEIKDAMMKMGPNYHYMTIDDKLYVNTGDGIWRRLRYEKHSVSKE